MAEETLLPDQKMYINVNLPRVYEKFLFEHEFLRKQYCIYLIYDSDTLSTLKFCQKV